MQGPLGFTRCEGSMSYWVLILGLILHVRRLGAMTGEGQADDNELKITKSAASLSSLLFFPETWQPVSQGQFHPVLWASSGRIHERHTPHLLEQMKSPRETLHTHGRWVLSSEHSVYRPRSLQFGVRQGYWTPASGSLLVHTGLKAQNDFFLERG